MVKDDSATRISGHFQGMEDDGKINEQILQILSANNHDMFEDEEGEESEQRAAATDLDLNLNNQKSLTTPFNYALN